MNEKTLHIQIDEEEEEEEKRVTSNNQVTLKKTYDVHSHLGNSHIILNLSSGLFISGHIIF